MDKQKLLVLGAGVVGLVLLIRWNNKGADVAAPASTGTTGQSSQATALSKLLASLASIGVRPNYDGAAGTPAPAPAPAAASTPAPAPAASVPVFGGTMPAAAAPATSTVDADGLRTYSDGSKEQMSPDAFYMYKLQISGQPISYF